jgi:RNA-dependent RNA polymerase
MTMIFTYLLRQFQAVDYAKTGKPVKIDSKHKLPPTLIRCKPDWHSAEVTSPRLGPDYYESDRALGRMYRSITLDDLEAATLGNQSTHSPAQNPISQKLMSRVVQYLRPYDLKPDEKSDNVANIFQRYVDELQYICETHTLSDAPGLRLLETEVVAGTILAKCTQKRWRKERKYTMRHHASTLVRDIQKELVENMGSPSQEQLVDGLTNAWQAWDLSLHRSNEFGGGSFGLIALDVVFECLERLP